MLLNWGKAHDQSTYSSINCLYSIKLYCRVKLLNYRHSELLRFHRRTLTEPYYNSLANWGIIGWANTVQAFALLSNLLVRISLNCLCLSTSNYANWKLRSKWLKPYTRHYLYIIIIVLVLDIIIMLIMMLRLDFNSRLLGLRVPFRAE